MVFDNYELLEVAHIIRIHGVKGFVNVKFLDNFSCNILKKDIPVFLNIDGIPVPFFIEQIKNLGQTSLLKFKYINSAEDVKRYKSCSVHIFASSVHNNISEEEYEDDWDFYNYEVFDKKHGYVGIVRNLNLIPGNPVFETDFNGKSIILPYSENFIISIDKENKKLEIEAPDGLIDLYL